MAQRTTASYRAIVAANADPTIGDHRPDTSKKVGAKMSGLTRVSASSRTKELAQPRAPLESPRERFRMVTEVCVGVYVLL